MNKKILLTSTQYPGNGGAATNTYKLIKFLKNNGMNVYGIFFLCNNEDINKINIDPDNLGNITYFKTYWKDGTIQNNQDFINKNITSIINYLGGYPDIILGKNLLAPISSKILFPKSEIIYLVSGVYLLTLLNNNNDNCISSQLFMNNYLEYEEQIKELKKNANILIEYKTLEVCSKIITNSKLTKDIMIKLFPEYKNKFTNNINTSFLNKREENLIDFINRKYDIIYVCSNFKRKIKNSIFVNELFMDKRLKEYKKIVIGDNNIFDDTIYNLKVNKQIPNKDVLKYMNNSKLLLLPSLFDSNSNTLHEGYQMGCNLILSKNVGENELFKNVCEDIYNKEEWIEKIIYNIKNKNNDKLNRIDLLEKIMDII